MTGHGLAVDALATALRAQVLDGTLPGGAPLREVALAAEHGVARNTLRTALRVLQGEGLVAIAPNRGARVAHLDAEGVRGLYELRRVLETGAVRLALERHDGRLPGAVHAAAEAFATTCLAPGLPWTAIVEGHAAVHGALVAAAGSPRITQAYHALSGELRLFVIQGRRAFDLERLASTHRTLPGAIEREGAQVLEDHLRDGATDVGGLA